MMVRVMTVILMMTKTMNGYISQLISVASLFNIDMNFLGNDERSMVQELYLLSLGISILLE